MADRTHEAKDERAGRTAPAPPASHVSQEASVESIGERPTDTDRDDRTGSGQGPESTPRDAGGRRDEFISSEVSDRTARPMRNSKTQS
ncbi:MAG: hypothetical protein DMF77_03015 [Acidobacteria bacterium]|nr:MAG: hypothetical protein DMF77_03015 [Acidobacteriota bacterium]